EIEKLQKDEEKEDEKFIDVVINKNMKLGQKVLIPVKQFPKFNFVGKLLGPRGNSLKRLQEDTLTKMSILGKGSMRDKEKEEELRKSGEAKYQHLNEDLHVLIEVFAPPAEAYARMGHALDEIKKFLIPDYNDEIRQAQLQELTYLNGGSEESEAPAVRGKPVARSRGTTGLASALGCLRVTPGRFKNELLKITMWDIILDYFEGRILCLCSGGATMGTPVPSPGHLVAASMADSDSPTTRRAPWEMESSTAWFGAQIAARGSCMDSAAWLDESSAPPGGAIRTRWSSTWNTSRWVIKRASHHHSRSQSREEEDYACGGGVVKEEKCVVLWNCVWAVWHGEDVSHS
ncbi:KHDR3 protein, partial [Polypterus senegalus]